MMRNLGSVVVLMTVACLVCLEAVQAQPQVHMKALSFMDDDGPYIEVQFYFPGTSLLRKEVDSASAQSRVRNTVIVRKGEEIVNFEKYVLTGPKSNQPVDLQDVLRFRVPRGTVTIEATTTDLFGQDAKTITHDTISTQFSKTSMSASDIVLYSHIRRSEETDPEKFIRGGYFVEPLTHNFYHRELDELISYIELYNTDQAFSSDFALSYVLYKRGDNGKMIEIKRTYQKMSPDSRNAVFLRMDISDVASGTYSFGVEVMDQEKNVEIRKSVRLFRSKPSLDRRESVRRASYEESFVKELSSEELRYSLKAIAPKVDQRDVERFNRLIDRGSAEAQRSFLYNFWYRVDPIHTKTTYDAYMEVADALDNMFDTGFGYGFETDRGYIYLKYGRPDDMITVEDDPAAPPYEIWTYYQLPSTSERNVKFVFYNPHLTTNGFELLHSTARQEINNPQWLLELYEDAPDEVQGDNFLNADKMEDNWNRHALEYFNDN